MLNTIKILTRVQQEEDTINFWKAKSFEEKLEAVQVLREQFMDLFNKHKEYDASREGLRRFYKVLQRQ